MNTDNAISLGNLMYAKEYGKVIVEGQKMLRENPQDAGVHVSLMDAFYKLREVNPSYFGLSTEHARLAILYGHDTGYAHERLLKDLREMDYYYQALQLCLMVMRPDFEFSSRGCGNKDYFAKAAATVRKRIDQGRAKDNPDAVVFTPQQIERLILLTRQHKQREADAQKLWIKVQAAWEAGHDAEYDRLLKQYHKLQASL